MDNIFCYTGKNMHRFHLNKGNNVICLSTPTLKKKAIKNMDKKQSAFPTSLKDSVYHQHKEDNSLYPLKKSNGHTREHETKLILAYLLTMLYTHSNQRFLVGENYK